MKKITISNETAQAVLSKIEAFKTNKNKVQLTIGIKNLGDGLACRAVIVNGGMMAEIGFKSLGIPKDFNEESLPYYNVVVSAAMFVSYLKEFLAFDSNIDFEYDEKSSLSLKVGTQARVAIGTAVEMDTMLASEHKSAYVMAKVDTLKLLEVLKVGGYLASAAVDERGIMDRVVLKFNDTLVTAYSTDGNVVSKAWCEAAVQFSKPNRCVAFLTQKLERLAEADKVSFKERLRAVANSPEETVKLAVAEGYKDTPLNIALPASSVNVLRNVIAGTEKLNVMVSANHMVVNSGNLLATFSLAGKVSEFYAKSIDPWQMLDWTSQVVVDKEALVTALSIIRLGVSEVGGKKNLYPFHTSSKNTRLVLADARKNTVAVPLIASAGDLAKINIHLDVEKVLSVLGKLANGNIVIRYFVNSDGRIAIPVCISNGDLEGKGVSSYTYIAPVNVRKDAETQNAEMGSGKKRQVDEAPTNTASSGAVSEKTETANASIPATEDDKEYIPDLPEEGNLDEMLV